MDIMMDLETLGNNSNSVIIAIGAVKFDPALNRITDRFYSRVSPQSCIDVGMVMDADTVLWWMKQSDSARKEFDAHLPPLQPALVGFTGWVNKTASPARVWGNGATFDNVILSNAYKAIKSARPWTYQNDRCYRTIKALYPDVPPVDFGTAHRADHDAEAQAMHLMRIWPKLRAA